MKTKNYIVSKKYVIYAKNTHTNTKKKSANDKKYQKVRDNFHYTGKCRGASHNNSNLRYKTSKEIRVVFHNGSTDDYHFIIKGLAEKFEGQFECLGKKIEIYMTFSVSIKKELDNGKTITYKRKFIDSFRFMSSSLSNLVDNLSEGLHNDKCTDYKSFLDYMIGKGEKWIFSWFECKNNYKKNFKRFASICEFCDRDINKFILLLKKWVYLYEYMDSWKRFDEKLLPDKEAFYISLNMEDVVDVDYRHVKRVYKEFNNKNICDYHYLYVQNNGLLLAEILENFRNKCIEIYELDPDHYAWQACLKKTAIKF